MSAKTRELDAQLSATIGAMRDGRKKITAEIEEILQLGEERNAELSALLDDLRTAIEELRAARELIQNALIQSLVKWVVDKDLRPVKKQTAKQRKR